MLKQLPTSVCIKFVHRQNHGKPLSIFITEKYLLNSLYFILSKMIGYFQKYMVMMLCSVSKFYQVNV